MGESILVIGLIRKRAELAGEVRKAERHLTRLLQDVAAIDRALGLTGYERDPASIPAKERSSHREREEALRVRAFTREALQQANAPIRTAAIARGYIVANGLGTDPRSREFYREKVKTALRYMRSHGEAEMLGCNAGARWQRRQD
jgi:hypothetical protein